jgi:hypothetical protein
MACEYVWYELGGKLKPFHDIERDLSFSTKACKSFPSAFRNLLTNITQFLHIEPLP